MIEKNNSPIDIKLADRVGFSEYSQRASIIDVAGKCRLMGLAAYQITGDFRINFPENVSEGDRRKIHEFNRENNIHIHFHAPGDIPLASRHEPLRLGGVKRLTEFIELAIELGAASFIFHPGRFAYYKISSGAIVMADRKIPEVYFERFLDSVSRLVDFAGGKIDLLLENTYGFSNQVIETIDRLLELPATGLVWDIGHMSEKIPALKARKTDPNQMAQFFADRLGKIKLAHIHDVSNGKGHLPLGTGALNIPAFLEVISQLNIEMIIEVFSEQDLKTSLNYIESLSVKNW
ncbi:MAG: TIM barrel protein [candidate division Zixibacteria bacterium]|nr:TIM barrel protein [candidate division Zixibacteria bacterium]